jgi:hypothetical protein
VEVEGDLDRLEEAICTGKCGAASGGSFKDGFGSASAVLEHTETSQRIHIDCIVPGPTSCQSSHRSELRRLCTAAFFTTALLEHHHGSEASLMDGKIAVGCGEGSGFRPLF